MRPLVLALVLAAGAPAARAQEPVELLPAGAKAVVAVDDAPAFWERLRGTRLWASLAALPSAREEAQEAGLDEATWTALMGRRSATGFYGETAGDKPDVVAVIEVADPALARTALAAIEERLAARREATFADDVHQGTPLRVGRDMAGAEVAWAIAGDRLVAGSNRARVVAALDLATGRAAGSTMAAEPDLADARRRLAPAAIVFWLDAEAMARELPVGREAAFARWLALGLRWEEGGLRGDTYLALSEVAPPEIVRVAAAPPGPIHSTAIYPAETLVLFATAAFDAPVLVAGLRQSVTAGSDSVAADSLFAARLEAWEAKTGIDIETELAPAIGREVSLALIGVDRAGPFPLPIIAAAIEVQDEAKARAVLEKLERWTADELARGRSIPLAWQGESYQGVTIRYAPTPFGERLEATHAVSGGFALFGSNRSVVRALLDVRADRETALAEGPALGAMAEFFPAEASGLAFIDLASLSVAIADVARGFGWVSEGDANVAAILAAIQNAPRLGVWGEPDGESGVWWRALLEVR